MIDQFDHWRYQQWGTGACAPLELAHVHRFVNFCLRTTPVGSDRLLVNTTRFLFQPQIHSRVSWLNVSLLYLCRNLCGFCLISWTRTPCSSWRKILVMPLIMTFLHDPDMVKSSDEFVNGCIPMQPTAAHGCNGDLPVSTVLVRSCIWQKQFAENNPRLRHEPRRDETSVRLTYEWRVIWSETLVQLVTKLV